SIGVKYIEPSMVALHAAGQTRRRRLSQGRTSQNNRSVQAPRQREQRPQLEQKRLQANRQVRRQRRTVPRPERRV
ncbi:MAG: hypothetical protein ABEI86_08670, partial [Halobacteriaceae archaeon]